MRKRHVCEDLSNKIGKEGLEFFVESLDLDICSGYCCFQRGVAGGGNGLVCGFVAWGDLEVDLHCAQRLHSSIFKRRFRKHLVVFTVLKGGLMQQSIRKSEVIQKKL